jgi:hypothetical protein
MQEVQERERQRREVREREREVQREVREREHKETYHFIVFVEGQKGQLWPPSQMVVVEHKPVVLWQVGAVAVVDECHILSSGGADGEWVGGRGLRGRGLERAHVHRMCTCTRPRRCM